MISESLREYNKSPPMCQGGSTMPKSSTIAQRKYDSANCKFYHLKFNLRTDADVIAKLESVPSRQDYLRQLVRKDLAATDNKED